MQAASRHGLKLSARLAILALIAIPANARAAEPDSKNYGLSWVMNHRSLQSSTILVDMSLIETEHGLMYVADLYGDGLVRFRVAEKTAIALMAGQANARVQMDFKTISDTVGAVGLGALASAVQFHQEKDSLILEAEEISATALDNAKHLKLSELTYFQHPWQQPMKPANHKAHGKAQTTAITISSNALSAIALQPPPLPPMSGMTY